MTAPAHSPTRAGPASRPRRAISVDGADDGEADGQEHRVVEAGQQLQQHRAGAQQPVPHPAGVEQPVPGPERQRHPLRPLQLEVRQVDAAIGREREHQAGDDGGAAVAGEPRREQVGEERRRGDGEQDQPVGDAVGIDAERRERGAEDALQEDRVRVGQRPPIGPEDVAVEQMPGVTDLMRDPAQPPRRERRIEMCRRQFGQPGGERPCENDTEQRVKKEDTRIGDPRPLEPFLQRRWGVHDETRNFDTQLYARPLPADQLAQGPTAARAVLHIVGRW